MSIIATAVKHLLAAGVTGDALVRAIADMEAAIAPSKPPLLDENNRVRRFGGAQWQRVRLEVFERDNFTCQYCGLGEPDGVVDFHCDHIVPIARGGTNDIENLATACAFCNTSKGAKTLQEWMQ
jgi:hypothetical protein